MKLHTDRPVKPHLRRLATTLCLFASLPVLADLSEGLVAHYPFDDGTATNTAGNGHNGSANGVTWVAGKSGLAAQFDGSGSYIDLGTDSELDFDQPFTVTLWFQLHGAPFPPDIARNLITRWDSYVGGVVRNERQFSIGIESDDRLSTAVTADGGHPAVLVDGTDVLPTSQWTFCSVSWDGTTLRLYKNGNEVGSMPQNYIAPAPHLRTAIGALLGDPTCGSASTLNGVIDEVRIYDRVLSKEEIEELSGGVSRGLKAYYPLDGDARNTASDSWHGTIHGAIPCKDRFGRQDGAMHFNGVDSYIAVDGAITTKSPYTWSFWFRPDVAETSAWSYLICQGGEPGSWAVSPHVTINRPAWPGTIEAGSYAKGEPHTSTVVLSQVRAEWNTALWHHVLVTVQQDGTRTLYVNGRIEGTSQSDAEYEIWDHFYIGGHVSAGSYFFAGDIDDVRIFDRVLSAAEVQTLSGQGGVTVTRVEISTGPATVAEHSTNGYVCTAYFSDNTTSNVSASAQWSVTNEWAAAAGFYFEQGTNLVTGEASTEGTNITIQASYQGLKTTKAVEVAAATQFFDDFLYEDTSHLLMQNRWVGHTENYAAWWAPPAGRGKITVSPASEGILTLRQTRGTTGSGAGGQDCPILNTVDTKFFDGVYAAAVQFDMTPRAASDKVVQTFWAQNAAAFGSMNALYSECDFEYLDFNWWSFDTYTKTSPTLWMMSWQNAVDSNARDRFPSDAVAFLNGAFATLLFRVTRNAPVDYEVYDNAGLRISHRVSHARFSPKDYMQIFVNMWVESGQVLASDYAMKVDWVYFNTNASLSWSALQGKIQRFRTSATMVARVDTVPCRAPLSQGGDLDGDGMKDLDEMVAGTDPRESSSVFECDVAKAAVAQDPPSLTLFWPSSEGRRYRIDVSSDPTYALGFSIVEDDIAATPPKNARLITLPDTTARFLRVVVKSP